MALRDWLLTTMLFGACIHLARADEIALWNGDHLSGRITHLAADTLEIETEYAGPIEIRWSDVASLATDDPIIVLLFGESTETNTRLFPTRDGYVGFESGPGDVALDKIAYLNPTPDEASGIVNYSGHINVSAAQTRGNASYDQYSGDVDLTARAKRYRFTIGGNFNHVKEQVGETASNWVVKSNYDWFVAKKQFLYLRSSIERDRFADAHSRHTYGVGYGVQLIEDKQANISLRAGLDYVALRHFEDAQQEMSEDSRYLAFGWGTKASYKFGNRNELFHEHDGFWNISNTDQITVRSRTGVRIPLFKGINVSLQINADWEHKSLPERKHTDITRVLGLGYVW